jgi:hypothetical protein
MFYAMLALTCINAAIPFVVRGQTVKAACLRLLSRLVSLLLVCYWAYLLFSSLIFH